MVLSECFAFEFKTKSAFPQQFDFIILKFLSKI